MEDRLRPTKPPLANGALSANNMASSRSGTFLSRVLMAVLNVPVVFGAHAAVAQSSPPPVAIHQLPSYCQRSTLTGVKFMQMVQAIIAHGDLTDIAFLEKTFGTKFN